jgi:ribonuclease J
MLELCTVGGFSEVGKNMVAFKYKDEVIICDMGFYLPEVIRLSEDDVSKTDLTREQMIELGAIPDDSVIKDWKNKVKGIFVTHAHLDHIGAIPYLAEQYNCPVYGTPFSIEVIKSIIKDEGFRLKNKLIAIKPDSKLKISKNIQVEFVNVTHSTPQTVMIAIHTPSGIGLYANDFKFDNHPVIGKKPNYKRLKELGEKGIKVLVADALYSDSDMKTPSEKVAREMLKDVLLGTDNSKHLVIVTTFASQIARLKSIVEFGKKLNRKIVFLGRSLHKYVTAAQNVGIINFTNDVEIIRFSGRVKAKLKKIQKEPHKYLVVCTGNQGEPRAVLSRLAGKDLPYHFIPGDHIIFSCKTIPSPINIANRAFLEEKLKKQKLRLFKDIHSSGHAAREDLRDLLTLTKPEHVIPAHGGAKQVTPMADLCEDMGYKLGRTVHLMHDGQVLEME